MGFLRDERGGAIVILAVALTVLLVVTALVIDIGSLYSVRVNLVNTADAAALAGVALLPQDPQGAIGEAEKFASLNQVDECKASISLDQRKITVIVNQQVDYSFARIFGLTSRLVTAKAVAEVSPLSAAVGVIPFGIEKQNLIFGQLYRLKEGGGSGYNGNYQALALGSTGASNYKDNIMLGYKGKISINDWLKTETGDMSGPTKSGVNQRIKSCNDGCSYADYQPNCPRVVTVPMIDSIEVNGRNEVLVVGFARFFLAGVGGSGNNNYVQGHFLEELADGEGGSNGQDFGLRSTKLIE